jgi:ammonia channel protein AmtB
MGIDLQLTWLPGNLRHFGLQHVLADPSPGSPLIPDLLYSFYQLEFCCVTVAILMGGVSMIALGNVNMSHFV